MRQAGGPEAHRLAARHYGVERLRIPGERGARLGRRIVDRAVEIDGCRPGICSAVASRDVDVLAAERSRPVRRKHDLAAILAHVRLDVVEGVAVPCAAELADKRSRTERAIRALRAHEDVAGKQAALRSDASWRN